MVPDKKLEIQMSIFINKNDQLIDKSFFGRQIKYKIPRWVKLQKDKNEFIQSHATIKRWLNARNIHDLKGKEVQYIVLEFFEGDDDEKVAILKEGIAVQVRPEPKFEPLTEYINLYQDHIHKYLGHKTKNLNIAYLDTWSIYANTQHPNGLTLSHINDDLLHHFTNWRYEYRKPNCSRKGLVSDAIIKKEVNELKRCIEWCFAKELCNELPRIFQVKYKLPTRKVIKPVTPLDVEKQLDLLKYCKTYEDPFVHDYILFLLLTGIRIGEIDLLCISNFKIEDGAIEIHSLSIANTISGGKTTSAPRLIPITPTILEIYRRGNLFDDTKQYSKIRMTMKLKGKRSERLQSTLKRRKSGGLNLKTKNDDNPLPNPFIDFNFHLLRHTFITNQLLADKSPTEVSRRAGHKSINITFDRYGKYANIGIASYRDKYEAHLQFLDYDYFK